MGNSYVGLLNGQTYFADLVSAPYNIRKLFNASTLSKGGCYA